MTAFRGALGLTAEVHRRGACYEMRINHRNVTEAAYECGFNEISYFQNASSATRVFRPGNISCKHQKIQITICEDTILKAKMILITALFLVGFAV